MRVLPTNTNRLRPGQPVKLRSAGEILASLDERGCFEGVPFMPEMLGYLDNTSPFRVTAHVGRACDTVHYSGVRHLTNTVLLDDLRCSGAGHAGCQAQCRLYWKAAWLRPATEDAPGSNNDESSFERLRSLIEANVFQEHSTAQSRAFRCQATEMLAASEPVAWWSVRSFAKELTGGNVGPWRFIRITARIVAEEIGRRLGLVSQHPFRTEERGGDISQQPTHALMPGDLVQILPRDQIARTIEANGKNKGLWFDREMIPYCGQTTRVRTKVERFIDEGSGRLVELSSDCYILDDVVCQGDRSEGRWFCPRAIYPWWREAWLRPVEQSPNSSSDACND